MAILGYLWLGIWRWAQGARRYGLQCAPEFWEDTRGQLLVYVEFSSG